MENKNADIFSILNDHIGLICATLLGLSGLGAAPKIIKACKGVKDNYTYNTYNYPEKETTQPAQPLTPIESTHITRYKTAEDKKEDNANE